VKQCIGTFEGAFLLYSNLGCYLAKAILIQIAPQLPSILQGEQQSCHNCTRKPSAKFSLL